MKKELSKAVHHPVLFIDDWPQPPKCAYQDDFDNPGISDLKRWKLQTLLATNPWGIPLLAFSQAYEKMFGKPLEIGDHGFDTLYDMVCALTDIFTIQEPDDVTALMFPDYPQDKILHDARLGHNFEGPSTDGTVDYKTTDADTLIAYAWVNRDDDFPPDVVLAGEQYSELILPMTTAHIPGTRGVYQAIMVGAANPTRFHIQIKSDCLERIAKMSGDISLYFKKCGLPIEMFSVPAEFIYPGFPCLVYLEKERYWERCAIVGRSSRSRKVFVETVDYGGVRPVNPICLYLMPRKFFDLPKQGLLVSMIGLKPPGGSDTWPSSVGSRMRCFSNVDYWLDCLLVERKEQPKPAKSVSDVSTSASSSDCKRKRRSARQEPKYEVVLCDRNDDEMDIYLDEILAMETYAISDDERSDDVLNLRQQLSNALKDIPRPKNPLI